MNRIFIITAFCFLLFTFELSAQNTWLQTYDPYPNETLWNVEDVIECSDGGYAINGTYVNDEYMDIGFLLKTDSEGNFEWADKDTVSFHNQNESRAIVETEDGGILSASSLTIGSSAMIKRDLEGNREWVIPLNDIYIQSMTETNDNNIIAAGYSRINEESWPSITKLDNNSGIIWTQSYSFDNFEFGGFKSIARSADGGYLVAGMVFHQDNYYDILVLKTDINGDSLWSWTYDGYGNDDWTSKIIENSQGDIYISGYFACFNRFNSNFLIKLNSEGETISIIDEENNEDFYGCERMVDDVSNEQIVGFSYDDFSLSAYNYNNFIQWNTLFTFHYHGQGDRSLKKIDDGFIITGWGEVTTIALAKADSNGYIVNADDNIVELNSSLLFNYPNPFNPETTISFSIREDSKVKISIYNIKGQKVTTLLNDEMEKGKHDVIWKSKDSSGKSVASGVYFYQLNVNGKSKGMKKMLLLK